MFNRYLISTIYHVKHVIEDINYYNSSFPDNGYSQIKVALHHLSCLLFFLLHNATSSGMLAFNIGIIQKQVFFTLSSTI